MEMYSPMCRLAPEGMWLPRGRTGAQTSSPVGSWRQLLKQIRIWMGSWSAVQLYRASPWVTNEEHVFGKLFWPHTHCCYRRWNRNSTALSFKFHIEAPDVYHDKYLPCTEICDMYTGYTCSVSYTRDISTNLFWFFATRWAASVALTSVR